ncbi:hypothetical protein ACWCXH_38650 [Kitasatospora sp. NPDC001660]
MTVYALILSGRSAATTAARTRLGTPIRAFSLSVFSTQGRYGLKRYRGFAQPDEPSYRVVDLAGAPGQRR